MVISHDVEMLETVVNKVFHLDANRAEMDIYAWTGSATCSSARPTRSAASGSG